MNGEASELAHHILRKNMSHSGSQHGRGGSHHDSGIGGSGVSDSFYASTTSLTARHIAEASAEYASDQGGGGGGGQQRHHHFMPLNDRPVSLPDSHVLLNAMER